MQSKVKLTDKSSSGTTLFESTASFRVSKDGSVGWLSYKTSSESSTFEFTSTVNQ